MTIDYCDVPSPYAFPVSFIESAQAVHEIIAVTGSVRMNKRRGRTAPKHNSLTLLGGERIIKYKIQRTKSNTHRC